MKLVGKIAKAELRDGRFVRMPYPPYDVLVTLVDGEPFAIEDACNHAGASLCEGIRTDEGDAVVCPLHGYVFALRTGELRAPKGLCDDQRRFLATIEGDDVIVWDPFDVKIGFG